MHHSSVPPEIPGTQVPPSEVHGLREQVATLLMRDNTRFPGAQPVSFARHHIEELQRTEYFLCEKTDGIRCLLFLYFLEDAAGNFQPLTFLIDRKNNYYEVQPPFRFPHYRFPNDADKYLFSTILDGELVHDRVPGQPKPRLIFYVFDALVIDGQRVTDRPLDKRLGYMRDQVFKPHAHWLARNNGVPLGGTEPFRVKEKQMFPPYSIRDMFEVILPKLPHGNDGLVFTCKTTPYRFGTDPHILKWKPPHENTIDFKLRLGSFPLFDPEDGDEEGPIPDYDAPPDRIQLLVLHEKGNYQHFADMYFTTQDWDMLKSLGQRLDGRIIECFRDGQGRWTFKREDDGTPRFRDDKRDANHISTVESVLESLRDPVTEQDLLDASPAIRVAVKRMQEVEKERQRQWVREQIEMEREREAKKRKISEVDGVGVGMGAGGGAGGGA
ncbi:mRNA-capping enzyme subunit alpha [Westerdykella ornata]|uniref:mRNA-capping enzyme subunit alpha n=1 Tax=Westerdykella ornata TaxID=318751 RepID=A0A6A6JK88_WESOR|nr:mRNA-capping enzyme subunit alpha [Westerdykella ornata]KAF2277011.1 mRNA-capping enzyme subunit alpha [Westerdykella ornata]